MPSSSLIEATKIEKANLFRGWLFVCVATAVTYSVSADILNTHEPPDSLFPMASSVKSEYVVSSPLRYTRIQSQSDHERGVQSEYLALFLRPN